MLKKNQKLVSAAVVVLMLANIFSLTGCGKEENTGPQSDVEVPDGILEVRQESPEVQTAADTVKTQEKDAGTDSIMRAYSDKETVDEMNRKERAMLEEKVQAAGGLSEEQAVEIARKALETDLGERGKKLKLAIDEVYGWRSDLCVADWSEIKEEDRGAIAYSIGFNNAENEMDLKELINYVCVVNAEDGSILEAYEIQGLGGNTVYYEH